MQANPQKRTSWGGTGAFIPFFVCITLIGLGATAHWRALDLALAFVWVGFLIVGSVVVVCRNWKNRSEPRLVKFGQLAALPRSWQRWVLGEREK